MTKMRETEGRQLPIDDHKVCWDINLWGDGLLLLGIPTAFDIPGLGEYDGDGVLKVDLKELLEEYLEESESLDNGNGLLPIASLLREFADKYEAKAQG